MTRFLLFCTLVFALAYSNGKAAEKASLAEANNAFAFDLYGKLKGEKGNVFFSPFSVSAALSMTSVGAKGETLNQMANVLHLPANVHADFESLFKKLNGADSKAYQLSIANSLFGQKGSSWLPKFIEDTNRFYEAGIREVDFQNATEVARKEINNWVDSKTNKKIVDLMPPSSVSKDTNLVLVNAIYFKGNWQKTFNPKFTYKAPFQVSADKKSDVQMMQTSDRFNYLENENLQMVDMPYIKNELSMVILLPRKADGLAELEGQLIGETISKWIGEMKQKGNISVQLPKFKLESSFDLAQTLQAMGMSDAFNPSKADFSGMNGQSSQGRISIQKVMHKGFIDVNETGTEAAAATGVGTRLGGAAPKLMTCNHPFLFLIRENATGNILFLGRFSEPN